MTFLDLGVPEVFMNLLQKQGIQTPTPVQEKAIPLVRKGLDVIAEAPTGTGKTLAFVLPLLAKIKANVAVTQAMIISPTRELAMQTAKVTRSLAEAMGIRMVLVYGGQDIERQKEKLQHTPQLIIATPGRLLDYLRHHAVNLTHVNKVVLDEADELLRLGFLEDVELLLSNLAPDRQLLLFSATLPPRVLSLARRAMRNPVSIQIERPQHLATITQKIIRVKEHEKLEKLCALIDEYAPYLALVFCHTRERAHGIAFALARQGYLADELHGDLSQTQRNLVLRRFRTAKLQILVVTDIAARGLDIEGITHVFSYDLPQDAYWHIHRIGRTGRAGREGVAITFATEREMGRLRRILTEARMTIREEKPLQAKVHATQADSAKHNPAKKFISKAERAKVRAQKISKRRQSPRKVRVKTASRAKSSRAQRRH